jgi:hypothetical protein
VFFINTKLAYFDENKDVEGIYNTICIYSEDV